MAKTQPKGRAGLHCVSTSLFWVSCLNGTPNSPEMQLKWRLKNRKELAGLFHLTKKAAKLHPCAFPTVSSTIFVIVCRFQK